MGIKLSFRNLQNNKIYLIKPNGTKRSVKFVRGLKVIFRGSNNEVNLYEPLQKLKNVKIILTHDSVIDIGCKDNNTNLQGIKNTLIHGVGKTNVSIGKGVYIGSLWAYMEWDSQMSIGDDCMLSDSITIRAGDGHQIFDKLTNKNINSPANIKIGNHVWIGQNSMLLKNAKIPDGSVVGMASVVTKAFEQPSIILGGNPAKKIKENIEWKKNSIEELYE